MFIPARSGRLRLSSAEQQARERLCTSDPHAFRGVRHSTRNGWPRSLAKKKDHSGHSYRRRSISRTFQSQKILGNVPRPTDCILLRDYTTRDFTRGGDILCVNKEKIARALRGNISKT